MWKQPLRHRDMCSFLDKKRRRNKHSECVLVRITSCHRKLAVRRVYLESSKRQLETGDLNCFWETQRLHLRFNEKNKIKIHLFLAHCISDCHFNYILLERNVKRAPARFIFAGWVTNWPSVRFACMIFTQREPIFFSHTLIVFFLLHFFSETIKILVESRNEISRSEKLSFTVASSIWYPSVSQYRVQLLITRDKPLLRNTPWC